MPFIKQTRYHFCRNGHYISEEPYYVAVNAVLKPDWKQYSDVELVLAARMGESDAYKELMRRYAPAAKAVILGILRNEMEAEDIVQDTMLIAFRTLDSLEQIGKFPNWLCSIARYQAYRFLRKQKRIDIKLPRDNEPDMGLIASSTYDPARLYDKNEALQVLHRSLQLIPQVYREVLDLRYWRSMKIRDISAFLGIPESTIKWRLHKGKLLLKELIERIDDKENQGWKTNKK